MDKIKKQVYSKDKPKPQQDAEEEKEEKINAVGIANALSELLTSHYKKTRKQKAEDELAKSLNKKDLHDEDPEEEVEEN